MKKDSVPYDQRSGEFVRRGVDHGVGKKNPVGSDKVKVASPIPKGRHCPKFDGKV